MSGATGLDYSAVSAYLNEMGAEGEARQDIFRGIRAAERATLDVWAQHRQRTHGS
jgi:hypothetical protein